MFTILDISAYQGVRIDYAAARRVDHVRGLYAKVSEGGTFVDPSWAAHRRDATKAGLPVGGYHFARPDRHGPLEEADHFLAALGGHTALRPVLDIETGSGELTKWCSAFSRRVRSHAGVAPLIYTYSGFLSHFGRAVGNGLWIANYSRNDGSEHPVGSVAPWRRYHLHQFTSQGRVHGVAGRVDVSHSRPGLPFSFLVWPGLGT